MTNTVSGGIPLAPPLDLNVLNARRGPGSDAGSSGTSAPAFSRQPQQPAPRGPAGTTDFAEQLQRAAARPRRAFEPVVNDETPPLAPAGRVIDGPARPARVALVPPELHEQLAAALLARRRRITGDDGDQARTTSNVGSQDTVRIATQAAGAESTSGVPAKRAGKVPPPVPPRPQRLVAVVEQAAQPVPTKKATPPAVPPRPRPEVLAAFHARQNAVAARQEPKAAASREAKPDFEPAKAWGEPLSRKPALPREADEQSPQAAHPIGQAWEENDVIKVRL